MKDEFPGTDAVIFGHILHDWEDDVKKMLLKKSFDCLNKGGACIIIEEFIDEDRREKLPSFLMSLSMQFFCRGE